MNTDNFKINLNQKLVGPACDFDLCWCSGIL